MKSHVKVCANRLWFTKLELKDPEMRDMTRNGYIKCAHTGDYMPGKLCSPKCKWYEQRPVKHTFDMKKED